MPDTERKELRGHQARSNTTIHGRPAILLGLPFLAIGVVVTLLAADVLIHASDAKFNSGRPIVGVFGILFALAGGSFIVHGIRGLRRRARWQEFSMRRPDEPWYADYPWNADGEWDDTPQRFRRTVVAGIAWWAVLIPIQSVLLREKLAWPLFAFFGLFDLIGVFIFVYAGYLLVRRIRYGRTYVRFNRFPFFLGDRVDISFGTEKGIGAFDRMAFTLRCIEERYETRGTGRNRSQQVVSYQVYADELVMDQRGIDEGGEAPLAFPLPDDGALTTILAERPPQYWELEIHAETPGVDFKGTYLVPVYAGPAAG